MRQDTIDLGLAIEAASQTLGVWYPATNGLQIKCDPQDQSGVIWVRGQSEAMGVAISLPCETWQTVPGIVPDMEVSTGIRGDGLAYGTLMVRGVDEAWWW